MSDRHEDLRKKMNETDRVEDGMSRSLLEEHLALYFSSTEAERKVVIGELESAVRKNSDIVASSEHAAIQWRHKWPAPARAAILAIWRTPRES